MNTRSGVSDSPVSLSLIASAPQGELIAVTGVLRPSGIALFRPSGFRLVSTGHAGPARTLCYLKGSGHDFPGHSGALVVVEGRKYWVSGSRAPVVLVSSVRNVQK